jgi:hypothetical protein
MTNEHSKSNGGNGTGTAKAAEAAKRAITRKSLELPRASIDDVRPLVVAMAGLNGPSSRKLIFDQAGASASGGTAAKKWAALGFYGFREDVDGGKHDVSDRGRALISDDPDAEREAKQHALVDTGFRPLIDRFSGSPVREAAIAGVLQDDFEVPEERAEAAAALLAALAVEAGLVQDGSFKVAPIEQALEAVPEQGERKPASSHASATRPATRKQAPVREPQREQTPQPAASTRPGSEGQAGPFGVSVEIKIDAKDHTPEEIGRILREAREALTRTVD